MIRYTSSYDNFPASAISAASPISCHKLPHNYTHIPPSYRLAAIPTLDDAAVSELTIKKSMVSTELVKIREVDVILHDDYAAILPKSENLTSLAKGLWVRLSEA